MIIHFGILTLSDRSSRGERPDSSGPALADLIHAQNWVVTELAILPDDESAIRAMLTGWADSGKFDVILTTGGTGFSPRDVTPEATRAESLKKTPHAMLSRAVAGIRGQTLIINLPGSPKGALENFQTILPILPHAIQLLKNDPNSESSH
jgi:molybdopterin adenylyltransferase